MATGVPHDFPVEMRETLFAAVLVHDTIDPDAVMPGALRLPAADQFEPSFRLAHQVWLDGVRRRDLARLAGRVARLAPLDLGDRRLFRDMRARCKQLRFACVMLDARHGVPPRLDRVTRAMGAMQDALKHGRRVRAAARALPLRLQLTRPAFALLLREAADFRPTSGPALEGYVATQLAGLRAGLAEPGVSVRRFHDMRKSISRLVALYDIQRVLTPSDYHARLARFLGTLNGMMGGLHDELVERRMIDRREAAEDLVIPPGIATRLSALERSFQA